MRPDRILSASMALGLVLAAAVPAFADDPPDMVAAARVRAQARS